jgi:hypothetical protein
MARAVLVVSWRRRIKAPKLPRVMPSRVASWVWFQPIATSA